MLAWLTGPHLRSNQLRVLVIAVGLLISLTLLGGGYAGWLAASVIIAGGISAVLRTTGASWLLRWPAGAALGITLGLAATAAVAPSTLGITLTTARPVTGTGWAEATVVHEGGNPFCAGDCPHTTYRVASTVDAYHQRLLDAGFTPVVTDAARPGWHPGEHSDFGSRGTGDPVPRHYRLRSIRVWLTSDGPDTVEVTYAGVSLLHSGF